jgi:dimethylargininase
MKLINNRVIVCSPYTEYFRISETGKHNITSRANPEKAISQHLLLKATLCESGFKVYDIPELHDHPNSVFTRDASLVTPEGYIKLRMGLESRRGEEDWMAKQIESFGIKKAGSISGNGTVEGGDVILTGSIAFVGLSRRTNMEGLNQVSTILRTMNFDVRSIKVPPPFLHLGGAMSILSPTEVLCCQEIFPKEFFNGFNRIEVPRTDFVTGNVISFGNHEVITEKSNTVATDILRIKGYRVHTLDLSEFIKGTGGPSCLVLPVYKTQSF